LGAVAWFDKRGNRYLISKVFADKVQLGEIAANVDELLDEAYDYINCFKKSEIPKVANFD
jgi:hypothetical protein